MTTDARAEVAQQTSLRVQVGRLVVAVIAVLAIVHGAASLAFYKGALEEQLRLKASSVAHSVAGDSQLQLGVWAGYAQGVEERIAAAVERQAGVRFAAVIDEKGTVLGFACRSPEDAALRQAVAVASSIDGIVVAEAALEGRASSAPSGNTGPADDLGLLDPAAAPSPPPASSDGGGRARILVGVDRGELNQSLVQHALLSIVLALMALGVAVALVGRVFAGMFRRMRRVTDVAETLATGDLRLGVEDRGVDEIGAVARSVERVRERWTAIVRGIHGVSDGVVGATRRIAAEAARVAGGSNEQIDVARASAERSAAIVKDSQALYTIVDGMSAVTRQSRDALAQARDANRGVAAEMDRMLASLVENDGHREELSKNIVSIASALGATAQAVRAAAGPADDVVRRMQAAVEAANAITAHARVAVSQSSVALSSLGEQRASSDAVAAGAEQTERATAALEDAIGEVLDTTALIRDIADMTSMLSLNASIIAAQAGNHALGFGTVAEEIRTLATRTRSAVDGIERRTAEARRQLDAMGDVVSALGSTVNVSRTATAETAVVLEQVLEQMNGALTDVAGLAELIGEASEGTRQSRDAVALIDRETLRIEAALTRQRDAQRRLDESFAVMKKNAGGVREVSEQQTASSDRLIEGMARLARATEQLVSLSWAQTRSAEGIVKDTARVMKVSEANKQTVDAISGAVSHLEAEARALREAIQSLQTG